MHFVQICRLETEETEETGGGFQVLISRHSGGRIREDQQQTGAGAGANTKHTPVSPVKDLGDRVTKVSLHFLKTIYFPPAVARRLLIHH